MERHRLGGTEVTVATRAATLPTQAVVVPAPAPAAIAAVADAIELPDGVTATAVGMMFTRRLSYEEWEALGLDLERRLRVEEARLWVLKWWIADWLCYGEWRWGDKYLQAAGATGYDPQTLANLRTLGGKFLRSRRRENLSIEHHHEVAYLPEADADDLLDQAEEEHLSRNDLRERAQDRRAKNDGKDPHLVRAERILREVAVDKLAKVDMVQWAAVVDGSLIAPLRHEANDGAYREFLVQLIRLLEVRLDE